MHVREWIEVTLLGMLIFSELVSFLPKVEGNGVIQVAIAAVKVFSLLRR